MANRKEFRVHPLDRKLNKAIGVKLPLGGSPMFELSYSTEEQAISNLKNLLLTRKGERPFQPLFGTAIYSLLFENMTSNLSETLSQSLRKDIGYWLPYIIIDELVVSQEDDLNRLNISLSVRVTESGANTNITVFVTEQGNISIG